MGAPRHPRRRPPAPLPPAASTVALFGTAAAAAAAVVGVLAVAAAAAAAAAPPRGLPLSPSDLPAGWAATLLSSHPLAGATPPFPPKLVTWYQLHLQADVPSRVGQRHAAYERGGGGRTPASPLVGGERLVRAPLRGGTC